ncbi:hypothetical protein Tco_0449193 [Tanacetum coccineum]
MCPLGREHIKHEVKNEKLRLLLYQMTYTPYSVNANTPYKSVECQYAVLISQNMPYYLEEQICRLDCRIQYAVLGRRFDTSYPTGGYSVSGIGVVSTDTTLIAAAVIDYYKIIFFDCWLLVGPKQGEDNQ